MLSHTDPQAQTVAQGALEFIHYFRSTWMSFDMWRSWSRNGRERASRCLGIPIEGVIPTTNHLEALNGSLKKKYIPQWQNSGHRLRFDILIYHLTISILPQIYARRQMIIAYTTWKSERFRGAAGGNSIIGRNESYHSSLASEGVVFDAPRAWFEPDEHRDTLAGRILDTNKLHPIKPARLYEHWAKCESSSIAGHSYWLTLHPSGAGTCTCPDFLQVKAGACKHLRAFRVVIEDWMQHGKIDEVYHFATTPAEAIDVELRNRRWYEAVYAYALTPPAVSEEMQYIVDPYGLPANLVRNTGLELTDTPPGILLIPPPVRSLEKESELQAELQPDEDSEVADDHTSLNEALLPANAETPTATNNSVVVNHTHSAVVASVRLPTPPGIDSENMSNIQALTAQLQARLDYDISSVLPRLHGILVTLRQPDPQLEFVGSAQMQEFKDVIISLDETLTQIEDVPPAEPTSKSSVTVYSFKDTVNDET